MEEMTDEECIKLMIEDSKKLAMYFMSMDYGLNRTMNAITFFLTIITASAQIDEEDLRDMFRFVSKMKDSIEFN